MQPTALAADAIALMGAITELHWVNNYSGSALTITNLEPDPVFGGDLPARTLNFHF